MFKQSEWEAIQRVQWEGTLNALDIGGKEVYMWVLRPPKILVYSIFDTLENHESAIYLFCILGKESMVVVIWISFGHVSVLKLKILTQMLYLFS